MTLSDRIQTKLRRTSLVCADRSFEDAAHAWLLDPMLRRQVERELLLREMRWRSLC